MHYDEELDARGLVCPMPLVKARQAIQALEPGKILRVVATDRGSLSDFQGWAEIADEVELVHQESVQENGKDLYIHYIKKV